MYLEFPWIPIRDWNLPKLILNPEWSPWNSPESLSGIETGIWVIGWSKVPLGIPLNPYQGLKLSGIWGLFTSAVLEFPWIPIRDWNSFSAKYLLSDMPWNSPESLSGIETYFAWRSKWELAPWNSPESLSGIETYVCTDPVGRVLPWNSPESLSGIETSCRFNATELISTWNSPESLSGIETR